MGDPLDELPEEYLQHFFREATDSHPEHENDEDHAVLNGTIN